MGPISKNDATVFSADQILHSVQKRDRSFSKSTKTEINISKDKVKVLMKIIKCMFVLSRDVVAELVRAPYIIDVLTYVKGRGF